MDVVRQLRAAGITERRDRGGGGLVSEPVLVFRGVQHSFLEVFDQDANQIGEASMPGLHKAYELRDSEGTHVLTVSRKRWCLLYSTWVVGRADGREIGVIGHPRVKLSHTVRLVGSRAGALGQLKLWWNSGAAVLEDVKGAELARIAPQRDGEYVASIAPSAAEPLRTIALAATLVCDLASHSSSTGG